MNGIISRPNGKRAVINSYAAEDSTFSVSQPAFMPEEGVGAQARYDIRGHVVVRGRLLIVSAMGYATPMASHKHKRDVKFFGKATLMKDGRKIRSKPFVIGPSEAWSNQKFVPIGSASFEIPPAPENVDYTLVLEAGYHLVKTYGTASPIPATVKKEIKIIGVKK